MAKYINKKTREWLRALESGNFKQTQESLYNKIDGKSYGYCCLGVACQLNGFTKAKDDRSGMIVPDNIKLKERFIPNSEVPNTFFEKEFNFKKGTTDACVDMNDSSRMTFKQIAKKLRSNPSKYFKRLDK